MDGQTTAQVRQFLGVRSFVPRKGHILKRTLPLLTLGPDYLMITTIGPPWAAFLTDVAAIVIDKKAVLVRLRNGIAARFKASRTTIRLVQEELETRGIKFTTSSRSTFFEVNALPRRST